MSETVYIACCPVCGRTLFRGSADSYIEGGCPKCRNYIQITYKADGIRAVVCKQNKEREKK